MLSISCSVRYTWLVKKRFLKVEAWKKDLLPLRRFVTTEKVDVPATGFLNLFSRSAGAPQLKKYCPQTPEKVLCRNYLMGSKE